MLAGIVRLIVLVLDTVCFIPVVLLASLADAEGKLGFSVARWWAVLNNRVAGVRIDVRGREHLDPEAAYVFMSNHRSHLDVLALVEALWEFELRWVTKRELLRIPGFGWALRATRQIIVDRSNHVAALASLARAKSRLHNGISVVFFPEGTRSSGAMLPFKKGGFVFAIETGAPIVPIAVHGTAAVMPPAHWLVRRGGTVRVQIHPPIATSGLTRDDREALLVRVRRTIAAALGEPETTVAAERAGAHAAHGA